MRIQAGKREDTVDLIFESFTGIVRMGTESKAAEATLFLKNGEIEEGRGVCVRPQDASEALIDPANGSFLDEEIVALIQQKKATAHVQTLLATRTRLFRTCPGHPCNLKEIKLNEGAAFPNGIRYVSSASYYGRTYLATGTHHLLRWDGYELKDMTEDWDKDWSNWADDYENYYFPGCVCQHRGHLILAGYTDTKDTRAASQIRVAGSQYDITDTTRLMPFFEEIRTEDADKILAMASTGYALYLFKNRSVHYITGQDFVNFTDFNKKQLTTTVGICGPMAFVEGEYGIHFMSDWGAHLIPFANPTKIIDTSVPIKDVWSNKVDGTNWFMPRAEKGQLSRATMAYDNEKHQVVFCFKMTGDPR